ncbi:hypothetical protein AYO21_05589 [Fonsecaea monophora]|uniref:protein-tyrosine-phosphatase n=1 Tax=Fonsecaea monophora TaxID=254056 RepID=A0A177F8S9_9EURO|nr:hypothetical protein AYO21_05589 [Fonsecaea monophora]OAG40111.1 hypothetical protein AYO21_05589 [Fonsecaea monophora]
MLQRPKLVPIKAVPGLFISDRFAASSTRCRREDNIVRILSVAQDHEIGRAATDAHLDAHAARRGEGNEKQMEPLDIKTWAIEIDDDPLVDILQYLGEACDWIEEGLSLGRSGEEGGEEEEEELVAGNRNQLQPGILVHCKLGVSRSGAFVVGFLMRKFKLSYSDALALARESRPEICPNSGFEKQLRVWEFCQYSVYLDEDGQQTKQTERRKKPSYKAWIAERDNLLRRGEEDVNRARAASLASMAARFGRKRQDEMANEQSQDASESGGRESAQQNQRKLNWERVQKMEQDWNERLIRGRFRAGDGDAQGLEE